MLKGVDGNDDIGKLTRRMLEETGILNTRTGRPLSCCLENVLTDVYTDYPPGPSLSHLYGLRSFSTAEVDDHFPGNLGEEFIPH